MSLQFVMPTNVTEHPVNQAMEHFASLKCHLPNLTRKLFQEASLHGETMRGTILGHKATRSSSAVTEWKYCNRKLDTGTLRCIDVIGITSKCLLLVLHFNFEQIKRYKGPELETEQCS